MAERIRTVFRALEDGSELIGVTFKSMWKKTIGVFFKESNDAKEFSESFLTACDRKQSEWF